MQDMIAMKKMKALKDLINEMFALEAEGEGDEPISKNVITEAMAPDPSPEHEALESPEEEVQEHATGEEAMDQLAEEKRKFMKQSRVNPLKGKTKAIIVKAEMRRPEQKMMGKYDK